MKVNLGTIEFTDEECKAINKQAGRKGKATRVEAKEWAMQELGKAGEALLQQHG